MDPLERSEPLPLQQPRIAGAVARIAFLLLRAFGWRVVLAAPPPRKSVVVFHPHTSNWDFPIGLLAKWVVGIDFRWIGKRSLFASPLGAWFRRRGGIPVDRADPRGVVEELVARFDAESDFALVITPEGTRRRTDHWKSGFYRIAMAAGVPVGLAFLDRPTRTVGIGAWIALSGDVARDLDAMRAFYADKRGWTPRNAGTVGFRPRD